MYLAKSGNIRSGYTFVKLAKSLVEKLDAKDEEGRVLFCFAEVKCIIEPVTACLELFTEAERKSLARGDVYLACLNRLQYATNCIWSGLNLDIVYKVLDDAQRFFQKEGQDRSIVYILIIKRTAKKLLGTDDLNSSSRLEVLMKKHMIPRQAIRL